MKTLVACAFFLFFSITSATALNRASSPGTVKQSESFSFFRAHRQGGGVSLSWACAAPGITHFLVERSYDGEFFDAVGAMGCAGSRTHKFSDNGVYPGVIYYRITAVSASGENQTSAVVSVRIVRHG